MGLKQFLGRQARELALYPDVLQARCNSKPRVLFFPSMGREGSSLLRVYNIAEALAQQGWRTLVGPVQLKRSQRARLVRLLDPDLLVFQKCWTPLNDVTHSFGKPYVFDMDDADFLDPQLTDQVRRTVAGAEAVMAGSRYVAQWCATHNPRTHVVWTGTPIVDPNTPRRAHAARGPVIAWAQANPLAYPAEMAFVRRFADRLADRGVRFTLRFYGASTDDARNKLGMQFANHDLELKERLDYDAFCRSLQEVAVGLCPLVISSEYSRGKSFGKILSYLDAKVPVLASDAADHCLFFTAEAGLVSDDMTAWIDLAETLMADPARREAMAGTAFELLQDRLSLEAASGTVARVLRSVLDPDVTPPPFVGADSGKPV